MLINIFLETTRFFLIFIYWKWFYFTFMVIPFIKFGIILSFIMLLSAFCTTLPIFVWTQLEAFFRNTFEFWLFFIITYHLICIHSHAFIVIFFSAYHEHFCSKYVFLDPLITSIFLQAWPGSLMHLYIINIFVNENIDNFHIAFSHLYCLLQSYVVPY